MLKDHPLAFPNWQQTSNAERINQLKNCKTREIRLHSFHFICQAVKNFSSYEKKSSMWAVIVVGLNK